MKNCRFTAEITWDNELKKYIGIVPGMTGAHTQASTLDELYKNLEDVIRLCLQEMSEDEIKELPEFVGIQQISVAVMCFTGILMEGILHCLTMGMKK